MKTPSSLPTPQPRPDAHRYPLAALQLVKTYTRASYEEEFGIQAPPFDAARRPQAWFDSTASGRPDEPYVINYYGPGQRLMMKETITVRAAGAPNLPGEYRWEQWTVAPTAATYAGGTVNPLHLCGEPEAWSLRSDIFHDTGDFLDISEAPGFTYPADEPRRCWQIGTLRAGLLLNVRNAQGVDRPGQWRKEADGYTWVPAVLQTDSEQPWVPVPMRKLDNDEQLVATLTGWVVERPDLAPPESGGGGLSAADRAKLDEVAASVAGAAVKLDAVLALLRVIALPKG
jgi:hypothetical protein